MNYEKKVKVYATSMSDSQKDEYFFKFLTEIFMLGEPDYRPSFKIWPHAIEWQSHKCTRDGYIFMGDPNSRSTTHPEQHFYIYFMPIFDKDSANVQSVDDSVYFLMDGLDESFKENVSLYGSAVALEGDAPSDESPDTNSCAISISKKHAMHSITSSCQRRLLNIWANSIQCLECKEHKLIR